MLCFRTSKPTIPGHPVVCERPEKDIEAVQALAPRNQRAQLRTHVTHDTNMEHDFLAGSPTSDTLLTGEA